MVGAWLSAIKAAEMPEVAVTVVVCANTTSADRTQEPSTEQAPSGQARSPGSHLIWGWGVCHGKQGNEQRRET